MGSTHFFNSELILSMYNELYTPAFRAKRILLGLPPTAKGHLVCDGFTGSFKSSGGASERRELWATSNSVILPIELPGGWSGKGQPCDALFGFYKNKVRISMDQHIGCGLTYFSAPPFESLPLGPTGLLDALV